MSDSSGGASGAVVGAGIGGAVVVVIIIAVVIYCYLKARKENAHSNMTKTTDIFKTEASNTKYDYPVRSRVNQYPDPIAARHSNQKEKGHDEGHVNPAFARHSSDSSSVNSDVEGRDLTPPRVRRPQSGNVNEAFSSGSSYDDSSSVDDDIPGGSHRMECETEVLKSRTSYKKANKHSDLLDGPSIYKRTGDDSRHKSKIDDFPKRNPRSDSPLTIETLEKHEKITRQGSKEWDDKLSMWKDTPTKRRESPPPSNESLPETRTSLTTEGTMSSGQRFQKNPSLRRNSPARSSSHRRYRKDSEKDEKGRRKPRRTKSNERQSSSDRQHHDRSRSPGGGSHRSSSTGSHRSGSSSNGSQRSRRHEAKQINKEQAILPIFQETKKKKHVSVI